MGALGETEPAAIAEATVREHDETLCASVFEQMRAASTWFEPTHVTREEDARAADTASPPHDVWAGFGGLMRPALSPVDRLSHR